jgi:hypothetical protein
MEFLGKTAPSMRKEIETEKFPRQGCRLKLIESRGYILRQYNKFSYPPKNPIALRRWFFIALRMLDNF